MEIKGIYSILETIEVEAKYSINLPTSSKH